MQHAILSNAQMAEADRRTIEAGTPSYTLMQNAGRAAADFILEKYKADKILILCGPGNNGGDGFVIARHLKKAKRNPVCACLVDPQDLKGDALKAYKSWKGHCLRFEEVDSGHYDLVVDAVFGTGFKGALRSDVVACFEKINGDVVAVDIPSGVQGDTGEADPHTLKALHTVTFHRKKLGHLLYPGAGYCGQVKVVDIGIAADFEFEALENHPDLWLKQFPQKTADVHKYDFGHVLIYGAEELTGATRLAASACARAGAGLTTVLGRNGDLYRKSLPAHIMVRNDLKWSDKRVSARLYGPGGMAKGVKISLSRPCVLDADALLCMPEQLNENVVLTPHDGEFSKAFPHIQGTKHKKALATAKETGAVVVLKGAETVIAHPEGRVVINAHSTPCLATAGTGDVLAGLITGLLAQGMPAFEASCAAVWLHGDAALKFGPGLVASDLINLIPRVLQEELGFSA